MKSLLDVLSQHEEDDEDDDDNDSETSTAREKIEAVYGDIRPNATLEELMDEQNFAAIPEFLKSSKKTVSFTNVSVQRLTKWLTASSTFALFSDKSNVN